MVRTLSLEVFEPLPGLIKELPIPCVKDVMSVLSLAVLPGRKYLLRNALDRTSQVVNELGSPFYSQSLALSFREKGKSCRQIASVDTPLSLMVSHFARNLQRCTLGLSKGCPPN